MFIWENILYKHTDCKYYSLEKLKKTQNRVILYTVLLGFLVKWGKYDE